MKRWLATHGEGAIVESYRRRYSTPDPDEQDLVAGLSSFSVAACFAASER